MMIGKAVFYWIDLVLLKRIVFKGWVYILSP